MVYRGYLFDLDGTLYRGSQPIPGAAETLAELRAEGKVVRFITNNSSLTRQQYADKLTNMGMPAAPSEVYSTATGSASYLKDRGLMSAFVIGEPGLVSSLVDAGIGVKNAGEDGGVTPIASTNVDALVVGICWNFDYDLLASGMTVARTGVAFVAANRDATYPLEGDRLAPGSGAIVGALAICAEREPVVIGKPNPYLVQVALIEAGLTAAETLVVGDRVDTDIAAGVAAGCPTWLVLTGVTTVPPPGQPFGQDLSSLPRE